MLDVVMVDMLKRKDCQPEELQLKARTMAMPRRRLGSDVHSRHPTCQLFEVGATSASWRLPDDGRTFMGMVGVTG